MKSNYKELGKYIRQVNVENTEGREGNLLGVSVQKVFIPSIANTVGTDFTKYKVVKKGQFTYIPDTSRRGDKMGIALLKDYDNGLISNIYTVFEIIDERQLDPEYLMLWFKRPEFDRYARFKSHGSVREIFNWMEMCKIELPVPNIEVQKRIVSIYNILEKRIILNQKINKNLLKQLDVLFHDFSTHQEWPHICIGELAQKIAMGPFGSNIKVSTFVPSGVPIISGNHLRGYFLEEPSYNYITEEHAEKLKNSIVFPSDIVFTHAGNIGQVAMIPNGCDYKKYILSQRQFYLRCDITKIIPEYVTLFFHSKEGQRKLLSYANQTGVPSIAQPATNLKKITLPVPPIDKQKRFVEIIQPMINKYQLNTLEIRTLANLRDLLLPKLMSGKLDVSGINL